MTQSGQQQTQANEEVSPFVLSSRERLINGHRVVDIFRAPVMAMGSLSNPNSLSQAPPRTPNRGTLSVPGASTSLFHGSPQVAIPRLSGSPTPIGYTAAHRSFTTKPINFNRSNRSSGLDNSGVTETYTLTYGVKCQYGGRATARVVFVSSGLI